MKRSHIALGASVLALAMTGGPAWAAPTQTIDDSIGGAQVASVAVDAPVRVLSDGNNGSGASAAGGPQAIYDSVGAVQTGPVAVNAPVRVLSDGDNGSAPQGGSSSGPGPVKPGSQSVYDAVGAVQAGPVGAQAPVRVASDGENRPPAGTGTPGRQTSDDSVGTVQVGATDIRAPIRVLSDGDDESADSVGVVQIAPVRLSLPVRLLSDGDDSAAVASASEGQVADPGGSTSGPEALTVGTDGAGSPSLPHTPSGTPGRGVAELASDAVRTLDAYGPGSLPVAGLGLIGLLLLGSVMLAAGSGIRIARV